MSIINGRQIGGGSPLKSLVIVDEKGEELFGVVVSEEVMLTATPDKVIVGETFASDYGVAVGEDTRTYHTSHGAKIIPSGSEFVVRLANSDCYNYTVLHGMFCIWNSNLSNSVATDKIAIFDTVYPVQSTEALSTITKDDASKSVIFGITNNTDAPYVLRYITYKESEQNGN